MKKVAIITGSAVGLGKEIALALAKDGYVIVVHYRKSKKEALRVLDQVRQSSPESVVLRGDLTKEDDVGRMFNEVNKRFNRVDILVNNVGNFLYKKFGETSNAEFRDIVESNIYSTLFCSRAVLPTMRKQKNGHIINIGSVGAERTVFREKSVPYFLAKNGVYILTKAMAWEEARNGIRINMVSPASLVTDIFEPEDFPMGRSASFEDVVKTIHFLISDDAYYINGANIEVAGAFIPGML